MVREHTLTNGLRVVLEEMPDVESVAFELLIPGGVVLDPGSEIGGSLVLAELTARGAGGLSSRDLSNSFDARGIRHGEGASFDRYTYQASMLAPELLHALKLSSLMVLDPELPADEIEPIRDVLLLDITSLQDSPSRRAIVELSNRYYPAPYNRPNMGTEDGLRACTERSLRALWEARYAARGSILSIAGRIGDSDQVIAKIDDIYGAWSGTTCELPIPSKFPEHSQFHISQDTAQVQLVFAAPSTPVGHKHYYACKVMATILSGGMFGRLFIEVREKRGLVYSVFARHSAGKYFGTFLSYAGTTPERAAETSAIMLQELRGLRGTISEEELRRAKANLKASLIIGEESSAARAVCNASDIFLLGRIRTLDEIASAIDAVDTADIDAVLEQFPPHACMSLSLGNDAVPCTSLSGTLSGVQ